MGGSVNLEKGISRALKSNQISQNTTKNSMFKQESQLSTGMSVDDYTQRLRTTEKGASPSIGPTPLGERKISFMPMIQRAEA